MQIPEMLRNFYCYNDGRDMIGIADVEIPDLAFMTESIKGAGIAGEYDAPVVGHFQSLTTTINWRITTDDNINLLAPKAHMFTFMGSVQIYDEVLGEYTSKQVAVVMKCVPKKFSPGKFEVGAGMGTSGEFEILYLKMSVEGRELVEIDKVNFICKIDNVDYLDKTRKDIGRA